MYLSALCLEAVPSFLFFVNFFGKEMKHALLFTRTVMDLGGEFGVTVTVFPFNYCSFFFVFKNGLQCGKGITFRLFVLDKLKAE